MTALSDALAAAQARVVAVLAKSYVQGRVDREAAELMLAGQSRVSDLRAQGCVIEQRSAVRNGRRVSFYRLIRVEEAAA